MHASKIFRSTILQLLTVLYLSLVSNVTAQPMSSTHRQSRKPIIGALFAFTGEAAYWSDMMSKGLTLAAEELRQSGKEFDLFVENSGTSTAGSVTAYNKLLDINKAEFVIGNTWGFLTKPLRQIADQRRVPLLSPEPGCIGGGYSFSGGPHIERMEVALNQFFDSVPNLKTYSMMIFADPDWGLKNRDVFREVAQKRGLRELSVEETLEFTPPFKSLFPQLLKNAPDLLFVAHEPTASLEALRFLKYPGLIIQSSAVMEAIVSGNKTLASLDGVYFADTEPSAEFKQAFKKRFGVEPYLEAHTGYELLRTAVRALELNRNDPRAGLKEVKYQGVAGEIDYTTDGCGGNLSQWQMFQVRDGKIVRVGRQ